jgi:hypothetical protein
MSEILRRPWPLPPCPKRPRVRRNSSAGAVLRLRTGPHRPRLREPRPGTDPGHGAEAAARSVSPARECRAAGRSPRLGAARAHAASPGQREVELLAAPGRDVGVVFVGGQHETQRVDDVLGASSLVRPWLMAPGTSTTCATIHPSSSGSSYAMVIRSLARDRTITRDPDRAIRYTGGTLAPVLSSRRGSRVGS